MSASPHLELVSAWKAGNSIEAHSKGGGDPNRLLLLVAERNHGSSVNFMADVVLNEDEVRVLFNWLGAWLHGAYRA